MEDYSRHTLDLKNRLTIPAKYRDELGSRVVLSRGSEGNLLLFPHDVWLERIRRIDTEFEPGERNAMRMLVSIMSKTMSLDAQGRITLPNECLVHAGIDSAVIVVGQDHYCSIWAEEKWDAYVAALIKKYMPGYKDLEF